MAVTGITKYPARVSLPNGEVIDRAKLIVHDGEAVVWVLAGNRQPMAAARLPGVASWSTTGGGSVTVLVADDGTEWRVERGRGCGGCGSPLARFDPHRVRA